MAKGAQCCRFIGLPGLHPRRLAHVDPEDELTEVELPLVDPKWQFDPGYGDYRGLEPLEPEHRTDP